MNIISSEEREIAEALVEALYQLGIDEHLFSSKNLEALYNAEWQKVASEVGFHCFSGASRIVFSHPDLPNWVIKTDYRPKAHFTRREVMKYYEAEESGMQDFFCQVCPLGMYHNHEFYLAEKVVCGEYTMSEELSRRSEPYDEEDANGLYEYLLDEADQSEILDYAFGRDAGKIDCWLCDHGIDDIHMGNIGMLNDGTIVIIDYAGFNLEHMEVYDD